MRVEYQEVWIGGLNRGDVSTADAAFAPNCVIHLTGVAEPIVGVAAWKAAVQGFLTAFPDLPITMEDQIVSGDRVPMPVAWAGERIWVPLRPFAG